MRFLDTVGDADPCVLPGVFDLDTEWGSDDIGELLHVGLQCERSTLLGVLVGQCAPNKRLEFI